MEKVIEKLKSSLMETLRALDPIENILERTTKATKAIDEAILSLNHFLEKHRFANEQEEIIFFKKIKPEFLALKLEEASRYQLIVNRPIATPEIQLDYFTDELRALQAFFRMNSYHYQYFKNNLTDLDKMFFLRDAGPLTPPLAEITEIDGEFSTPMTFLFAKFIAFEHLQYCILEHIAAIQHPGFATRLSNTGDETALKWTGGLIDIVELIYGLFLTGQFNNGNASLNQIVRWMEVHLQVNIGIIQRKLTEIEQRKRVSSTKFIDQMKEAILKKIESRQA